MVIDVLLACYNGSAYLPQQLASLAAQSGEDFRVLMQDDGSQDGTPELLADWCQRDRRFQLVSDASPQRIHSAIGNFWSLLQQSDAPYIALCDQDDEWLPQRLHCCMAAMQAAELRWGADTPLLIHSDAQLIDAQGAILHESFFRHQGWDAEATTLPRLLVQNNVTGCTVLLNRPLCRLALAHGDPARMHMHDWFLALTAAAFGRLLVQNNVTGCTVLLNRPLCRLALAHGDPARMHMHDWFLALTAAAFGQVICIPQPLVRYRQHGENVMGASQAGLAERGVRALSAREKGRARIALTYRHTQAFLDAYGDTLPPAARKTVTRYLSLEHKHKPGRMLGILRGGYRMQSFVTRAGQLFFC